LLEGKTRERLTTASGAANVNLEAMIFNVNIYRFCHSAMLGSCLVHSWLPWPLGLAFRWLSEGRREGEEARERKQSPELRAFSRFGFLLMLINCPDISGPTLTPTRPLQVELGGALPHM
jgi:hypothetical protein